MQAINEDRRDLTEALADRQDEISLLTLVKDDLIEDLVAAQTEVKQLTSSSIYNRDYLACNDF